MCTTTPGSCHAGVGTPGVVHAGQALYQLSHVPSNFVVVVVDVCLVLNFVMFVF